MLRLIICALTLSLPAVLAARAHVGTVVGLRVYSTAARPARTMNVARRELADRFRRAGIQTTWQECGLVSASAVRCRQVLAPHELAIRIVEGPAVVPGAPLVLGYSYVDRATRRGTLATVFVDRVDDTARRTHIETGILLGRAIAHEVGHLILGSTDHSAEGLMRTWWSDETVRHRATAEWEFSGDEVVRLQQGILARLTDSEGPPPMLAKIAQPPIGSR